MSLNFKVNLRGHIFEEAARMNRIFQELRNDRVPPHKGVPILQAAFSHLSDKHYAEVRFELEAMQHVRAASKGIITPRMRRMDK
jgi:isopropylmalate/homocitrate/citramalate synthase